MAELHLHHNGRSATSPFFKNPPFGRRFKMFHLSRYNLGLKSVTFTLTLILTQLLAVTPYQSARQFTAPGHAPCNGNVLNSPAEREIGKNNTKIGNGSCFYGGILISPHHPPPQAGHGGEAAVLFLFSKAERCPNLPHNSGLYLEAFFKFPSSPGSGVSPFHNS